MHRLQSLWDVNSFWMGFLSNWWGLVKLNPPGMRRKRAENGFRFRLNFVLFLDHAVLAIPSSDPHHLVELPHVLLDNLPNWPQIAIENVGARYEQTILLLFPCRGICGRLPHLELHRVLHSKFHYVRLSNSIL